MKIIVSRVNKANISVENKVISSMEKGLAVFAGLEKKDSLPTLEQMAEKIVHLRIFEDEQGKMRYSVKDKNYSILCISNFTLCANTKKGRRPSFEEAMEPDKAKELFKEFVTILKSKGIDVQTGAFGKHMDIQVDMDGPVNVVL
ncbi:MAG: D-aminoacyl-tRNA deacylase [Candidatus Omnitrophota bacterium]